MTCSTCGHPQNRHKLGKGGCRNCEFGCREFVSAEAADVAEKERVLNVVANVCEDQADRARAELGQPTIAEQLAARERERDELASHLEGSRRVNADLMAERDGYKEAARSHQRRAEQAATACDTALRKRDEARAELAAANARIRDLACELEQASAEIERLRSAAEGYLQALPDPEVIYAYDAWQCLLPDGCGSRYIPATAAEDHPHPLTPVRVTITHRTEGHTE